MKSTNIAIEGMSCGHCVQQVSKALQSVPGVTVESVAVGSARIAAVDGNASKAAVLAIEAAGYQANATSTMLETSHQSAGGCCGG